MKANELRKGILLQANALHGGKVMSVRYFEDDDSMHKDFAPIVFFNESPNGEYLKDCSPIPLTPAKYWRRAGNIALLMSYVGMLPKVQMLILITVSPPFANILLAAVFSQPIT